MGDERPTDQPTIRPAGPRPPAVSVGRHPRDLVLLLAATAVVVLCSLAARQPVVNPVEVAIYGQLARIPAGSTVVWRVLTWAGDWAGIAVVAALALYLKRIRLGLQCAAAGVLAWGITRVVGGLVGSRPVPGELAHSADVRLPGPAGFGFPDSHAAVAAAMVAVAASYLKPMYRGLAWSAVVLVATADVYLGGHLPLDAFAGVFLGWGVGAAVRLVWGAPGRRTSEAAVRKALELAGFPVAEVAAVRRHLVGPLEFTVTTATGDRLRVEVVRRLHRRAGPWDCLRRLLASLEVEDEPPLSTPFHEAEHEALVSLFAERAGVRTPPVLLACETGHGAPLLVRQHVDGRRLTQLPDDEIGDALLDAIWTEVATLNEARIAHHDLRAKHFLVDVGGNPWLLDLTFGKVGATANRAGQDIAETLVSLASVVGVERTVGSASRTLSADQLEPALAFLHPLALPHRIRKQLSRQRFVLAELRETLAERIGRPIPTFPSPVRPRTVVGLLLLGGAVYTLLPQLSSIGAVFDALRSAHWGWLAVSTATGLLAIVAAAVSILGSSPTRLPFWRTTAVQLAAAFTGRTTPGGIGFFGINIAFLERLGIRRSQALGVTMLNMAATGAVGAVWCLIAILGFGTSRSLQHVSILRGWPTLAAVAGVLVLAGAVLASPLGRRRLIRPALQVARELLDTLRQPRRAVQLLGGVTAYLVLSGLGLAAGLEAFGADVPVLAALSVFVVGQTLGHIAPIPGGLGPVEGLMVAGLSAVGTTPAVAVAVVLATRLLTYWLPVLPGIAMFRYLQHHAVI